MMSTGLLWLQVEGSTALYSSMAAGEISLNSPPPMISESVASTPGPPALVTIVNRGPLGVGCLESTSAI